ncbi:hypothetical protein FACS189472_17290 [Alphaproteobacteria bacterium]|nr:hypothetical protein FACS189472_17290 [Alphaproteobacteria bacterium]
MAALPETHQIEAALGLLFLPEMERRVALQTVRTAYEEEERRRRRRREREREGEGRGGGDGREENVKERVPNFNAPELFLPYGVTNHGNYGDDEGRSPYVVELNDVFINANKLAGVIFFFFCYFGCLISVRGFFDV